MTNPENDILNKTEEDRCPSIQIVEQKNSYKKTEGEKSENLPKKEIKEKIRKKKREKNSKKNIKTKKCINKTKIITTNSFDKKINQNKKKLRENSKRYKKRLSFYFRKKTRNKFKPKLSPDNDSNIFVGSTELSLNYLDKGSPGPEKNYDNENINTIYVGKDEEGEYDSYDLNEIAHISFNFGYEYR